MAHSSTTRARTRAWSDLAAIVTHSHVWRALAFADIRSRYRFSTLGTLWITATTGVMAVSIGLIYGQLLGQDLSTYLPYLTAGIVAWTFMASVLNEASQTLIGAGTWVKGSSLPIAFHVMRMLQRNFIILLHNLLIVGLVWLYFQWPLHATALLAPIGLAIVYAFLSGMAIVISFLCVRFRDIPPMISALTQFVFFASPIIWLPDQLKVGQMLLTLNPIAYMLAVTRDPLLGRAVPLESWAVATVIALASVALALAVYSRYRGRIAYWV